MRQNKSGKISTGAIILIVAALFAIYYFDIGGVQSLFVQKQVTSPQQQGTTINTVNPIISVTALDKQASGSVVSVVGAQGAFSSGGFKSITLGTDTAVPGQTLDMLLPNGTAAMQYHTAYYGADVSGDNNVALTTSTVTVTPSTFPITVLFNKNATVTENIYSTTGLVISNEGGAASTNQTKLGDGATYNMRDAMSGQSLASTQDMVCVIEINAGNNVSTTSGQGVTYDGKAPFSTAKPTWYTVNGTSSNVYLFDTAPLASGAEVNRNIQVVNKATGSFSAQDMLIKTCYTKEYFLDPNSGKIVYDIADSNGNLKSIAQYKYKVYFQ
jgi:hypothetical protein